MSSKGADYPPKPRPYQPGKPIEYTSKPEYTGKPGYTPKSEYTGKPEYSPSYVPKYAPGSEAPKYGSGYTPSKYGHPGYHADDCLPHCPEIPPYQCGKSQCRLDPGEVKRCIEECCFEVTKCNKPPCLPLGKCAITKEYKPECANKTECSYILGMLKPDYDDPVKHIFERHENKSLHVWPHCTVGKIWAGANNNYACPLWTGTGVLVGRDLVLTASHTAPWDREGWWMRFAPAYSEGCEPFGSSYICDIRGYPVSGTCADDFVICKLFTPLGDACGWMGTEGWESDNNYTGQKWNMVGYSHLFKNGEVQFCEADEKIKKVKDDGCFRLIETHGDPWGWSGGVLWGWHGDCPCVIGILSGSEEECFIFIKTGWSGGEAMVDLVNWAVTNWG